MRPACAAHGPGADLPGPAGPGVRVLLDVPAGGSGAEGLPVPGRPVGERGRGGRGRRPRPGHPRRPEPHRRGLLPRAGPALGPSLRSDQVIGGGALWVLGDIVGLPFLAAQFIQMIREDETEAAGVDAELDAVEAAEAPRRRERSRWPPGRTGPPREPGTARRNRRSAALVGERPAVLRPLPVRG